MSSSAHVADDLLIDLATGLLAAGAEAEILRHLEACPACEARFREICRDAELARLRGPATRRRVRLPWWGAAAAAVLLVAVLAFVWNRPSAPEPADYWLPLGADTVGLRTSAADPDPVLEAATRAYRRRDAAEVVALLRGKQIPSTHDPLKIALASALVKTGRPAEARTLLDALEIATIPQPDRDRARWIRCAALLGEGKTAEAREALQALAARPGEFADAARRRLEAF
jgi:hypothetical protein